LYTFAAVWRFRGRDSGNR